MKRLLIALCLLFLFVPGAQANEPYGLVVLYRNICRGEPYSFTQQYSFDEASGQRPMEIVASIDYPRDAIGRSVGSIVTISPPPTSQNGPMLYWYVPMTVTLPVTVSYRFEISEEDISYMPNYQWTVVWAMAEYREGLSAGTFYKEEWRVSDCARLFLPLITK